MLRRVLGGCMFTAVALTAAAQTAVKGTVRDPGLLPVPFCNVYTQRDGLPLQFTNADENGNFFLHQPDPDSCELVVTSVGFKKYVTRIKPGNQVLLLEVILQPDTVSLDQVIVHGESPIQTRGDTVVYDASYFATGHEVALADLLKKLPGVSVDDQGKVKFQGKDIKKIKVEGDDLFESNYQLLTKNLSADLVEQVEVLQNYSDNPLLKNIEDSDDVALNLTLKKDRKKVFFGDLRGGSNFRDRYEAKTNLVSFLDRAKIYGLGSLNNIGTDPTGDVEELFQPGSQGGRLIGDDAGSTYLVPVAKPYVSEFRRDRYYFNQASFGSLNGIYKPAKSLSLKVTGYVYGDRTTFTMANVTDYYTPTDTLLFKEQASTGNREGLANLQATAMYQASSRMNITYKGRLSRSDGVLTQQSNLNQNKVHKQLEYEAGRQDHHVNLTRKFTDREAVAIDLRWLRETRPQRFGVDGNLVGSYFPAALASDTLTQASDFSTEFWGGEINYFRKMASGKMGWRASYKQTDQAIASSLSSSTGPLAENDLGNHQRETYAEGYFAWRRGKFTVTPAAAFQKFDISVSDRPSPSSAFLNPRIGVKYVITSRSVFSALYSQGSNPSSTEQLIRNPLLRDYNLIALGDDQFRTFARRTYLLNYQLGDWASRFSLFAAVFHQELPGDYLTNFDIEPNYTVSTTNQLADRKLSSLSIMMDRFFKSIRTNLKVDWRASRAEFVTSTEGLKATTTSNGHTLDISLRSAWTGPVNAHIGHILQASLTRSDLVEASNYSSLFYVDGYLMALKQRLNLTLHLERYELISIEGRPTFHFLDLLAKFRLHDNKPFLIYINARNLLNEEVYAQRSVSPQGIATTVNRLIPRYVLIGLEVRW